MSRAKWVAGAAMAAALLPATALARVDMFGTIQEAVSASGSTCNSARMIVPNIKNRSSSTTNNMQVSLLFKPSNDLFDGGSAYYVGNFTLGTLAGNQTVTGFDHTVGCSNTPVTGEYCVSILMIDTVANQTNDYVTFSGCQTWPLGGGCSLTCTSKQGFVPTVTTTSSSAVDADSVLLLAGLGIFARARRRRSQQAR